MAASINGKDFFDDSVFKGWDELLRDMDSAIKKTDELINSAKGLNKALSSGSFKERNKAVKESVKVTTQLSDQDKKLAQIQKQSNLITKDVVKAQVQLAQKRKAARIEAEKELQVVKKRNGIFKQNIKTLLTAGAAYLSLNVAIKGFKKILESTSKSGDEFAATMEGIGETTNEFFRLVRRGDFKSFTQDLKEAFERGKEYSLALNELKEDQRELSIETRETRIEIEKLRTIQGDTSKSLEERRNAGIKALRLQEQIGKREFDLANNRFEAELDFFTSQSGLTKQQIKDQITLRSERRSELESVNELNKALEEQEKIRQQTANSRGVRKTDEVLLRTNAAFKEQSDIVERLSTGPILQLQKELEKIGDASEDDLDRLTEAWKSALDVQLAFEKEQKRIAIQQGSINKQFLKEAGDNTRAVRAQIEPMKTISGLEELRAKNQEDLTLITNKATEAIIKQNEALEESNQKFQGFSEDTIARINQGASTANDLTSAATDLFVASQERELQSLQEKFNQGIITEEQFNQKRAEIQRKQAQALKDQRVFESIINTAAAVTSLGVITPQAILAGILGALQTAKIIATPIPAYKDGTENHIGGRAIVGDGGKHELVKLPDGTLFKTPDSPTLIDNLPKGAIVKPDFDRGMKDIARTNKSVQSPVVIPNTMTMKLKRDDGFEYRKTLRLNKYRGIRG